MTSTPINQPTTAMDSGPATPGGSDGLVLVLNSGSSSVKFALLVPGSGERLIAGMGERLGTPEALLRVRRFPGAAVKEWLPEGTHRAVVARVLDHLAAAGYSGPDLLGAGHRVVHGGEQFSSSIRVDDAVIAALRSFSHLAPLHNPANLAGIEAVRAVLPDLPQVAVFDTAFHQTMPPHAFRYAVPEEWYTGTRCADTGFTAQATALSASGPPPFSAGHPVSSGWLPHTSATGAVRPRCAMACRWTPPWGSPRWRDWSWGPVRAMWIRAFSPTWPAQTGMSLGKLTQALNIDSGLEGLSGVGNDMRTIVAAADDGNERARLALEVFVYRLSKAIAGLVVGLQRLDALVFTGGIGENSAVVRSMVLTRLGFLGLAEDAQANADHGQHTGGRISLPGPALALVVPTDEELLIARDTADVIAGGLAGSHQRPRSTS